MTLFFLARPPKASSREIYFNMIASEMSEMFLVTGMHDLM